MRCEGCGDKAPVLKTCRWRSGGGGAFPVCDRCYEAPVSRAVWIIPGPVPAHGTCRLCSEWVSVRELEDAKRGGRRDAPSGVCPSCAQLIG